MSDKKNGAGTPDLDRYLGLVEAAAGAARGGQLDELCRVTESALSELIGFKLLTMLKVEDGHLVRMHSSNLHDYPPGGAKLIAGDAWLERMLADAVPVISEGEPQVRSRFFDHEVIFSLGCQAVLNLPVHDLNRCLGSVNLLHAKGHFQTRHIRLALPFIHLLALAWGG